MFDGIKSKFEALMESIEKPVQISGQIAIHIGFSKLTGSLLLTAKRLKTRLPNLTLMEIKKELSIQYSIIPSNTHATQAFTHLEQGQDKLVDDYLHCVSQLLSKIYHTSDTSRISAEGTNLYVVVYCLNCRKLKDSVAGYQGIHCTGRFSGSTSWI